MDDLAATSDATALIRATAVPRPMPNVTVGAVATNAPVVLRLEAAIVDDAEGVTLEQWVLRLIKPWNQGEDQVRGLRIISVLDQLLENWKSAFVSISKIVP
ncbi:MAG: hypothetical protein VBE63_17650 [Lamprobacter sp.]|uniref:hypothetical protein n=1 Tax=Lamprobacter sp. TaxID=3100796 RepID=UPI002B2629CD|nr:hypothetical protein [Lamprobacter sp.]MEA3641742.1 hypothetical protein [Lamprobacter sp.]